MPAPIVNRRPKAYFAVFSSLFGATIMILVTHYYEERARELFVAFGEDFDEWKIARWLFSVMSVCGFIFIYNLFFGTEGRRRRRVFYSFCLSGVLCIVVFNSIWWGVLAALGLMLAVLLAGQFYIERSERGGQA
jgi:hypothetical protein